jgi:hypothetical protein
MSNKNLFYGNWQNFIKKQSLQEMEQQFRDLIEHVTEVAFSNPEILPFGAIFGDKLRIAVPLIQKNSGKVQTILDFIYNFGAISSAIYQPIKIEAVTKQVRTKVAGRDTTKEIADFVVTKLDRAENPKTGQFYNKETKTTVPNILRKAVLDFKRLIPLKQKELEQVSADAPEWKRQMHVDAIEFANKRITVANQMIEWWQKNQAKIIEDVELVKFLGSLGNTNFINGSWENFASESDADMGKAESKYSVIYSRVPIDVLRMSDFDEQNIESCHSPGNSYFKCAVAEAQNQGAIAFAVRTEDLEGVDLDQREVFEDKKEGIEGITPVQRLRIRTLKDSEKDVIYGIPEIRPYPSQKINGFQQEVKKFVTNVQKELFIKEEPDGQKKLDFTTDTNNLTTLGGSYFDSSMGSILSSMLETLVKEEGVTATQSQKHFIKATASTRIRHSYSEDQYSWVSEDEDDEEEMHRETEEENFRQGLRLIRDTYLNNTCDFDWQWGEDYANIDYDVSFKLTLPKEMFTQTFLNARDEVLDEQIKDALADSDIFNYPDTEMKNVFVVISSVVQINVTYGDSLTEGEQFVTRMRDFTAFCARTPKEEVEAELIAIMSELGFIEEDTESIETVTQKFQTFNRWVRNNTNHFFHTAQSGDKHMYRLVPNKKNEKVNDTNYSTTTWLIAKFNPDQINSITTYSLNHKLKSKHKSEACVNIRNLI